MKALLRVSLVALAVFTGTLPMTVCSGKETNAPQLSITVEGGGGGRQDTSLSTVWIQKAGGLQEGAFWFTQGITNTPINLFVPGKGHYLLFIADGRVLPFLGRKGHATEPATIWSLPAIPVRIHRLPGKAFISDCKLVFFQDGKLALSDWSRGDSGVNWLFWPDPTGRLHVSIKVDPGL